MKAFVIESGGKTIITTSVDVLTVTQDAFRKLFNVAFTSQSEIIQSLEVVECQLINPHTNILTVEAKIKVGENLIIETTAGINYDFTNVTVHSVTSTVGTIQLTEWVIEKSIKPLIESHMNIQFKPEIHNFYSK